MPDHASPAATTQLRRPLDGDRVPVLPPGVPYLMQTLQDDDRDFQAIADAIEKVPSVAARLLALANSAWSAPRSPVLSIEAACSRLGLRVVRTASIALAVSQPFNPARCPAFKGATFWSTALLNAEAAGWLAGRLMRDQTSVARTAGLLSNLGLVWLAESLPEQTASALQAARGAPSGDINRVLTEQAGLGYDQAGALLAQAWRLPKQLSEAIAHQFHGDADLPPLCLVVAGATRMVGAVRRGQDWTSPDPGLSRLGMDLATQAAGLEAVTGLQQKTAALAETLFVGG